MLSIFKPSLVSLFYTYFQSFILRYILSTFQILCDFIQINKVLHSMKVKNTCTLVFYIGFIILNSTVN